MKLEHSLTSYTKISSKWIKDLSQTRYYKTLREKHRQNTIWHNHSNIFLHPPPRAMKIKIENKWDLIKLNFCTAKEIINQMKRQPSEWETIFASNVNYKGLISKIYKQLMKLNFKKQKNQTKKWAEELNRHFSKGDYQMVKSKWNDAQHH